MKIFILLSMFLVSFQAYSLEILECDKFPETPKDSRTCAKAAFAKSEPILATLKELSPDLQILINRIDRVVISKAFSGTLMIVPDIDPSSGKARSYQFAVSDRALLYKSDLSGLLKWKEQQFIGDKAKEIAPQFSATIPGSRFPMLYYGFIHELAHMVWYEYSIESISCVNPPMKALPYSVAAAYLDRYLKASGKSWKDVQCAYSPNGFRAFSWELPVVFDKNDGVVNTPLRNHSIEELAKICFYDCKATSAWTGEEVRSLYTKLFNTSYPSVYGAYAKPEEDFAESFSMRYLAHDPRNEIKLKVLNLDTYDLVRRTNDKVFEGKAQFLDALIKKIKSDSDSYRR